jgi:hypothetical protein
MNKRFVATTLVITSLAVTGCANNPVADSISSLQVCASSVRILTGMEEALRLALANPMAAGTYTERLSELSDEFAALKPRDSELATAHTALSARIDVVVETMENPSASGLAALPAVIAESQSALRDYAEACAP